MIDKKLCPHCKTGKYTYQLDKHSTDCPYIDGYKKGKCPMFVKLDDKKPNFFEKIIKQFKK